MDFVIFGYSTTKTVVRGCRDYDTETGWYLEVWELADGERIAGYKRGKHPNMSSAKYWAVRALREPLEAELARVDTWAVAP